MDYNYDVFLSYLHEPPSGTWVTEHFFPYFQHQLGNALGRKASIFLDRNEMKVGQKWPARLKEALAVSRCMLGIWSPLYFQSEWCRNESAIMLHREAELGYGTDQHPRGLIAGVKINDGIHFPNYATEKQFADFERFFIDGPAFRKCDLHAEFQLAIPTLALEVAELVNNAPTWSPHWRTPAWNDEVIARCQKPSPPTVQQPVLD